jgi:cell division protein FtsI (penicillin-binding protein 3)
MGFAPVNRPAIAIAVTLNGASRLGGAVAAPVFERVASAALRFLDIPKDLPDEPLPEIDEEPASDLSIAELGGPHMDAEEFAQAFAAGAVPVKPAILRVEASKPAVEPPPARVFGPEPPPPPVQPVVATGPKVPKFVGKTMRTVLEESTEAGIVVETKGIGIARLQDPPPGAVLRSGERVRVIFAR